LNAVLKDLIEITEAGKRRGAQKLILRAAPDVVLLDINLATRTDWSCFRMIKKTGRKQKSSC
jgi:DNA-binding NarL/FixJ family response regulator